MSLLTVGTVAFDTIETPNGKAEMVVGGSCTYVSMAAAYFYKNINLVAVVGDDFPESELDGFKQLGINLEGLQVKKGEKSFFWHGRYHANMNSRDTLETQLNVLADFNPILPDSYKNSEYIMLGNLSPAVQASVLDQLTSKPKLIVMDTMNFWMDIAMDELKKVIARVDVLTINDEEARQLSGEFFLPKAAEAIHKMGPKYLIIKKGEHGALLFGEGKVFAAPGLPLSAVFDPTGAGDTFAGGFIGYLAKSGEANFENMKRAIIYGSALASFCVERFSNENIKNLSEEKIAARVQEFVDLSSFRM
jgi:sugar/nucleoside kinase (ribokinase family)